MIRNELLKNNGRCILSVNGHTVPVCLTAITDCADEPSRFKGYIDTDIASMYHTKHMLTKQMINSLYGKDAVKPKFDFRYVELGDEVAEYCKKDVAAIMELVEYEKKYKERNKMKIEKVIFNDPATIVLWKDGTKTVVKAQDEPFNEEKGLAMAISKKALGNQGNYFEEFKKWLPEEDTRPRILFNGKTLAEATADALSRVIYAAKKESEETPWYDLKCADCRHQGATWQNEPCKSCVKKNKYEAKKKVHCLNCKHKNVLCTAYPCGVCIGWNKFEAKE